MVATCTCDAWTGVHTSMVTVELRDARGIHGAQDAVFQRDPIGFTPPFRSFGRLTGTGADGARSEGERAAAQFRPLELELDG